MRDVPNLPQPTRALGTAPVPQRLRVSRDGWVDVAVITLVCALGLVGGLIAARPTTPTARTSPDRAVPYTTARPDDATPAPSAGGTSPDPTGPGSTGSMARVALPSPSDRAAASARQKGGPAVPARPFCLAASRLVDVGQGGFVGALVLTNVSSVAWTNWRGAATFGPTTQVVSSSGAAIVGSGAARAIVPDPSTSFVPVGDSVVIQFQGWTSQAAASPTHLTVQGHTCKAGAMPPIGPDRPSAPPAR